MNEIVNFVQIIQHAGLYCSFIIANLTENLNLLSYQLKPGSKAIRR